MNSKIDVEAEVVVEPFQKFVKRKDKSQKLAQGSSFGVFGGLGLDCRSLVLLVILQNVLIQVFCSLFLYFLSI